MPISDYGVWKGTPTSFTAQTLQQDSSPHITLKFDDGSGAEKEAAINVASTDSDSDLVYWLHRTWSHPITKGLTSLDNGFHKSSSSTSSNSSSSGAPALDYVRTKPALVDFTQGRILNDNGGTVSQNNILSQLEPILNDAIAAKATIYIFGSSYGTGIHDIHMNQGSQPQYENGVDEDGGMVFHYATDGHWEAVFLAFASQSVPTDASTGAAESGGQTLASIAKGTAVTSSAT